MTGIVLAADATAGMVWYRLSAALLWIGLAMLALAWLRALILTRQESNANVWLTPRRWAQAMTRRERRATGRHRSY